MRCTDCSTKIRPVVAIDIDGTLGDYHGHLLSFAEKYLGRIIEPLPSHQYTGSEAHRDWFCRIADVDVRTYRDIKLAYRQGAQKRSMPQYKGATWFVNRLHDEDLEVWITTTRPFQRHDGVDPDTREWLRRNDIPYNGLLYSDDKYKDLGERVEAERVIAVLDDLPEQYDAAAEEFGLSVPILRRNPHNDAVKRPNIAYDFKMAYSIIKRKADQWRRHHAENR